MSWAIALAVGIGAVGVAEDADAAPGGKKKGLTVGRARTAVPEIPIGGAAAALTLILGGTAIALDRRRRKRQAK